MIANVCLFLELKKYLFFHFENDSYSYIYYVMPNLYIYRLLFFITATEVQYALWSNIYLYFVINVMFEMHVMKSNSI